MTALFSADFVAFIDSIGNMLALTQKMDIRFFRLSGTNKLLKCGSPEPIPELQHMGAGGRTSSVTMIEIIFNNSVRFLPH